MNTYSQQIIKKQNGATLVVSLVILVVVTVLGLASMRSSNLELKMSASARDRSVAFQNAESALRKLESDLKAPGTAKRNSQLVSSCSGEGCFEESCSSGLCFSGEYNIGMKESQCQVAKQDKEIQQMWKEPALWNNSQKVLIPNSAGGTNTNKVQYLIEFLCFVPDPNTQAGSGTGDEPMLPLYRITVRAEGEAKRSSVVLQSVYRAATVQI